MDPSAFREALAHACVVYAMGLPGYTRLMDRINAQASDAQWKDLERTLDLVDEWIVDGGKGSLRQREDVAARRAGRPSRYPSTLLLGTDKANAAIAMLRREYGLSEGEGGR